MGWYIWYHINESPRTAPMQSSREEALDVKTSIDRALMLQAEALMTFSGDQLSQVVYFRFNTENKIFLFFFL